MDTQTRILFAGGTTGGHLFPGVAVAEQLQCAGMHVAFSGIGRQLECHVAAERGYDFWKVPAVTSHDLRRRPWSAVLAGRKAWKCARRTLIEAQPDLVVGLGGYASIPVVLAAGRAGIPVTLLEQNVIPGRATRWLSRSARSVCVSFDETIEMLPRHARCRVTGNPVRAALAEPPRVSSIPRVLVLGGSQGARRLNEAVPVALSRCRGRAADWEVVHQCGDEPIEPIRDAYRTAGWRAQVVHFLESPQEWFNDAGIVVSRSGATTLAELACAGRPAILVPYPHATDNHQSANARWFSRQSAAVQVEESTDEFPRQLGCEIEALLGSPESRERLTRNIRDLARPQAAGQVADEIVRLLPMIKAA